MTKIDIINSLKTAKKFPLFRVGDTVKVHVKIKEGEKERIQVFEGIVIKKRGGEAKGASFCVRKISYGIGVERIFPIESSAIDQIEVVKHGKVRRSKLFYLRAKKGRAAQVQELSREDAFTVEQDSDDVTPPVIKADGQAAAQITT